MAPWCPRPEPVPGTILTRPSSPLLCCWLPLFLLAADLRAQSTAARDSDAEVLLSRWVAAAGGPRVWDGVRDLSYTTTTIWYDSAGAERRRRPRFVWIEKFDGGFRVRVERTEPEGKYVQVWGGQSAWATLDGQPVPDTARALREVLYVAGDLTYWIGLPWKLRDPGVNLRYFARDTSAAGRGFQVSFAGGTGEHPGDRYWYYFGEDSPFPTEVHYLEEGQPDSTRTRVRFDDWGSNQGARFMGGRTLFNARGIKLRSLVITDVTPNRGVNSTLFRKP
jgi:hypothetical protein